MTGLGTAADPWLFSGTGLSQITTDDSGLSGSSSIQFVPFVQDELSNHASGGTFTISATVNGSTETTGAIAYNASATSVQTALNKLAGVQVTVTGAGTAADPWLIAGTGYSSLASNDSFSGGGSSTVAPLPPAPQNLWTTATGGDLTIQMTVGGQVRTATFAYNASAATVQAALDGMDPSVAAQVTGRGTAGDPWLISGSGVSALTVVPFGLTRRQQHARAAPANSQVLWNTATGGTFRATVFNEFFEPETTAAIAYNASAAAVALALNVAARSVSQRTGRRHRHRSLGHQRTQLGTHNQRLRPGGGRRRQRRRTAQPADDCGGHPECSGGQPGRVLEPGLGGADRPGHRRKCALRLRRRGLERHRRSEPGIRSAGRHDQRHRRQHHAHEHSRRHRFDRAA